MHQFDSAQENDETHLAFIKCQFLKKIYIYIYTFTSLLNSVRFVSESRAVVSWTNKLE